MGILSAYITKSLLVSIGVVLLIIFALDFSGDFFYRYGRFSDTLAVSSIMAGILVETPFKILEYIPSALLIGGVMGLGLLARGSEVTVMLASGCSRLRLMTTVLLIGLVISVTSLLVHEFYGPKAITQMQKLKAAEHSSRLLVAQDASVWLRASEQFMRFGEIVSDQLIKKVTIYQFDEEFRLRRILQADTAIRDESRWKLKNVATTTLGMDRIVRSYDEVLDWSDFSFTGAISSANTSPNSLSIINLQRHIRELQVNQLDAYEYQSALFQRYAFVASALAMLAFSFPLVVTSRKMTSIGYRIVLAIMLSFVVYALSQALASAGSVYRLPPILVAFLPTVLMVFGTIQIMYWQR